MAVYLLCFDQPFKHARHYSGFAEGEDPAKRIAQHGTSDGARLLKVAKESGITWTVVRVWPEGTRTFERSLKKRGQSAICPRCRERFLEEKRARAARSRAKQKEKLQAPTEQTEQASPNTPHGGKVTPDAYDKAR